MTGCSSDDNSAPGDEPTTTSVVAASTTPPPLTAATTSETVESSNSVGGGTDASTPGVPAGGAAPAWTPVSTSAAAPAAPGPATESTKCTDQINYVGDPRSNAEINSIGERMGSCPAPLPPDAVDRSLAHGHREAQRIGVLDRLRPALAATAGVAPFQEARRPDHLTGDSRPPEGAGHRRALRRRLHPERFQPGAPLPRRCQGTDQSTIHHAAQRRPHGSPDATSDQTADPAQNHLRHYRPPVVLSGQANAAASRRIHQGPIQLSTTARPQ